MPTLFLQDKPIKIWIQDKLRLRDFVEKIRSAIENSAPPFVFGILGDWGTGKTSALNLLKNSFDDHPSSGNYYIPIIFNAWMYENEANLVYPLLHAIKKDYETRVDILDEARHFGKRFLQMVGASTLALTDIGLRVTSKRILGDAITLEDLEKHFQTILDKPDVVEKTLSNWADQVGELQETFDKLLDAYAHDMALAREEVSKEDVRFVILIDDLDRCLPHTAINVLESIKNYLSVDRCVYILGLNPQVIYQGVQTKYQGLHIDGRAYLEKILNYSFYVPTPEGKLVSSFAIDSLSDLLPEDLKRLYEPPIKIFGKVLKETRFTNPRKVKRILNHYLYFLDSFEFEKYQLANIVKLIVLFEYFPKVVPAFRNDAARLDIKKLGGADFSIQEFQDHFGISLHDSYSDLLGMRNLLVMDEISEGQARFATHYDAVLSFLGVSR